MKTAINFIITCYDKEEYLHGILETIRSYKKIDARIAICYNGHLKSFPCDVRIPNNGHQLGDIGLTLAGYQHLKTNGINLFCKIAIDSWLLDDEILLSIFDAMENDGSCYAGNHWFSENDQSLATDIIFANTKYGNIFESFEWDGQFFETSLYSTMVKNNYKASIIKERIPVVPDYRFSCESLKWTMEHDLKSNLKSLWVHQESKK